jgi:hypothetical protein
MLRSFLSIQMGAVVAPSRALVQHELSFQPRKLRLKFFMGMLLGILALTEWSPALYLSLKNG